MSNALLIKLKVVYVNPPIPVRGWDWCCYKDDDRDTHTSIGWGYTPTRAILDFLEAYEDDWTTNGSEIRVTIDRSRSISSVEQVPCQNPPSQSTASAISESTSSSSQSKRWHSKEE